jgi:LemA protein
VTSLRSKGISTKSIQDQSEINQEIYPKINQILVTVEKYPEIKSSENFVKIQNQFVEIEDAIQFARRYYNGTVRNLNISIQSFPNSIISSIFNFKLAEYFQADEAARNDVGMG